MASPPLELHGFGVDQPTKPDGHALHTDPISARLEAGFAVTKRQALVHSRYTFWPRQASPHRLAVPMRLAFVRAACHPHQRFSGSGCPQASTRPLRVHTGRTRALATVDLGLPDPVTQRFPVDAQPIRYPGDRPLLLAGLLPDLAHHPHGPLTDLVRVLLRCWHDSYLRKVGSLQRTRGGSMARWVLPVPGGPRKTTLSRLATKSRVPRWAMVSRLRPRAGSKSNSSRDLRAGKRAARMRPSPPWDSRAETSRCRQATRNSSCDQDSARARSASRGTDSRSVGAFNARVR